MGKRNKNKDKKKTALVFDESKRREFLCGFRKRKLERKKKAQEELKQMLKEEKRRIKQENKESYKKLVVSSRPIPDIEELLKEEYEDDDVNVKIVELSSDTLQKRNLCIGENRVKVEKDKVEKNNLDKKVDNEIHGMGFNEESEKEDSQSEADDTEDKNLKTKKEIKRMLKKQATKKIQKSKVFQMKNKLERIKNKKKSHQKHSKHGQIKNKHNNVKEKGKKGVFKRKQK